VAVVQALKLTRYRKGQLSRLVTLELASLGPGGSQSLIIFLASKGTRRPSRFKMC
jgi:hypothetical protein